MRKLSLINIEWNHINGFEFSILNQECEWSDVNGALFGLYFSKNFLYLDVFYKTFKIFDKTDK